MQTEITAICQTTIKTLEGEVSAPVYWQGDRLCVTPLRRIGMFSEKYFTVSVTSSGLKLSAELPELNLERAIAIAGHLDNHPEIARVIDGKRVTAENRNAAKRAVTTALWQFSEPPA